MEAIANSITPDHLKLILTFILAVMSIVKLTDINNNRTKIKSMESVHIQGSATSEVLSRKFKDGDSSSQQNGLKKQALIKKTSTSLSENTHTSIIDDIPQQCKTAGEYIDYLYNTKIKTDQLIKEQQKYQMEIQINQSNAQQELDQANLKIEENNGIYETPKYQRISDANFDKFGTPKTAQSITKMKSKPLSRYIYKGLNLKKVQKKRKEGQSPASKPLRRSLMLMPEVNERIEKRKMICKGEKIRWRVKKLKNDFFG